MEEIFWIITLPKIGTALCCAGGVILSIFAVMLLLAFVSQGEVLQFGKGLIVGTSISLLAVLVGYSIPTQKEMLIIFGVGGTIDYVKSNQKAMQIPDKCIDALDRCLDSICPEGTNTNTNNNENNNVQKP